MGGDLVWSQTEDLSTRVVTGWYDWLTAPFTYRAEHALFELPPLIATVVRMTFTRSAGDVTVGSALVNPDSEFTFDTRRATVDILKLMQSESAYAQLRSARQTIADGESSLSTAEQALVDDLLARIDRATTPYFDH